MISKKLKKIFNRMIYPTSRFDFTKTTQINFYEILRIDKNSSLEKIQESYDNIVKHHSDDKELIFMVNMAYETLSNKESKQSYDQFMINDPAFEEWNFRDNIYCRESSRQDHINRNQREQKTSYKVDLEPETLDLFVDKLLIFDDLFREHQEINTYRREMCIECKGRKTKDKNAFISFCCSNENCSKCFGSGFSITNPCEVCNGKGFLNNKNFKIKVELREINFQNLKPVLFKQEGSISKNLIRKGDLYVKFLFQKMLNSFGGTEFNIESGNLVYYKSIELRDVIKHDTHSFKIQTMNGIKEIKISSNDIIKGKYMIPNTGFKLEKGYSNTEIIFNINLINGMLLNSRDSNTLISILERI